MLLYATSLLAGGIVGQLAADYIVYPTQEFFFPEGSSQPNYITDKLIVGLVGVLSLSAMAVLLDGYVDQFMFLLTGWASMILARESAYGAFLMWKIRGTA